MNTWSGSILKGIDTNMYDFGSPSVRLTSPYPPRPLYLTYADIFSFPRNINMYVQCISSNKQVLVTNVALLAKVTFSAQASI